MSRRTPFLLIACVIALYCVFCVQKASADIYLHNPRGSNNKLDEANNNRQNPNRLFDSQNNNNGGYNTGGMYYYVGSVLYVEYTAQHGQNNPNLHDNVIVQYSCDDKMPGARNGNNRNTIPDNAVNSRMIEWGQHETYTYYQKCKRRNRNPDLYWADQNPGGNKAINTRQNRNGARYGFECPEEKDYYPYWAPSPWKDLAILTSDTSRCEYYRQESENVKGRFECLDANSKDNSTFYPYITQESCESAGGIWEQRDSHNLPPPQCLQSCYSRDNHLGNSNGGYPCYVNVTIPDTVSERCVLRIRYNISTGDFDGWGVSAANNTGGRNLGKYPITKTYPSGSGVVRLTDNPQVDIGIGVKLHIALNTDQTFRTFQDRSHIFAIRPRPASAGGALIHNLNVRGRRGNIVQVYPSVEYDFCPNHLVAQIGEQIHFQWTGSNTNPNGNDGEGLAGTDRSNLVEIKNLRSNYPLAGNYTFFDGFSNVKRFALLDRPQLGGETQTLDDAGTYFDGGLVALNRTGEWYFASTRNNNFSNRSQKLTITVTPIQLTPGSIAGIVVGTVVGGSAVLAGIGAVSYYAFRLTFGAKASVV